MTLETDLVVYSRENLDIRGLEVQKLASVQGSVPTTDQQSVMTGRGKGKETKVGRGREGRAVRPGSSVWRMGFCQSLALLGESKAQCGRRDEWPQG